MVTYNTAESAMDNLFNWIMNSPNNTMVSMVVSCNYSGESVSGSLNAGAFLLVGYRRHTYANITAYSYWNSRSMSIATIEDNSWTKRFDRVITNTDLSTYYSMDNAIEIPKNADLNNYHQFGNYISIAASTTDTLKNCPLTGSGFAMHVERITGDRSDYCKQRIISNNSNAREYWRTKLEGVWQKWYMVVGEQVN